MLRPLGLHWRGPLFLAMAERVASGGMPGDDLAALVQLPGVGPYAASAYLSMHRDKRAPIVDSNVVRLVTRILGRTHDGETRRKKWLIELVERITPSQQVRNFNFALLDLAMKVCRPAPLCDECPLADLPCRSIRSTGPRSARRPRMAAGTRA